MLKQEYGESDFIDDVYFTLAVAYFKWGKYAEAIAGFNEVMAVFPG